MLHQKTRLLGHSGARHEGAKSQFTAGDANRIGRGHANPTRFDSVYGILAGHRETVLDMIDVRQVFIRLGSQVMIPGNIMQSASPIIISRTNGVAER